MNNACLTEKDFAILEAMLARLQALGDPLAPLMERKLADAVIVPSAEVDVAVATLNSRVAFRVDARPLEERTLVRHEERGAIGHGLPIDTRRGLAILGMVAGQTADVARRGGGHETIRLEKILYQPEATRHAAQGVAAWPRRERPTLVLVHNADNDCRPLGGTGKTRQERTDDDDPGPTAA